MPAEIYLIDHTLERYRWVGPIEDSDDWARRLAAKPDWALHMTKSQFQAYGVTRTLGDVSTLDGDLLTEATGEDPGRFVWRKD